MIISKGLFFFDFHEYAIYCGITWRQTNQEGFDFITFHYSNCCILPVKTMQHNSKTDRIKYAQYKVESWHYKTLMAFAYKQKIFKKVLQISQVRTFISPVIGPKCQVNWTRWVEMRTKLLRESGEQMKPQIKKPIKKLLSEAESLYLEGTLSQLLLPSINIVWNQFQLSNKMKFSLTFTAKSLDNFYFKYKCQCDVVLLVHM